MSVGNFFGWVFLISGSALSAPTPKESKGPENVRTAQVYEANDPEKRILYRYKMWTEKQGEELLRKAIFVKQDGATALEESYWTKDRTFTHYELKDNERSRTCRVRSENGKLFYEMSDKTPDGEKLKTDNEALEPLHAVGPGILDRLSDLWDKGLAGETVELRLSVPDRFESFWFRYKKIAETDAEVTFDLRPSSFVIAMFVKPIELTYDKATRLLKTYRGTTFITHRVGNEWKQLEVGMDYDMAAMPKKGLSAAACLPGQVQCSVKQP